MLMLAAALLFLLFSASTVVRGEEANNECPQDWLQLGSLCVLVSQEEEEWWRAWKKCRGQGSHLAYIGTSEESLIITGILLAEGSNNTWIGLNDLTVDGNFVWADKEPVSFTDFATGEPSKNGTHADEDCVAINRAKHYRWDDQYCFLKHRYICRMKLEKQ